MTATLKCLMAFFNLTEADLAKELQPQFILEVEKSELNINAGLQDRVIQVSIFILSGSLINSLRQLLVLRKQFSLKGLTFLVFGKISKNEQKRARHEFSRKSNQSKDFQTKVVLLKGWVVCRIFLNEHQKRHQNVLFITKK